MGDGPPRPTNGSGGARGVMEVQRGIRLVKHLFPHLSLDPEDNGIISGIGIMGFISDNRNSRNRTRIIEGSQRHNQLTLLSTR